MPAELEETLVVEALAQRYHCTPATILDHPAWLLSHYSAVELFHSERSGTPA